MWENWRRDTIKDMVCMLLCRSGEVAHAGTRAQIDYGEEGEKLRDWKKINGEGDGNLKRRWLNTLRPLPHLDLWPCLFVFHVLVNETDAPIPPPDKMHATPLYHSVEYLLRIGDWTPGPNDMVDNQSSDECKSTGSLSKIYDRFLRKDVGWIWSTECTHACI